MIVSFQNFSYPQRHRQAVAPEFAPFLPHLPHVDPTDDSKAAQHEQRPNTRRSLQELSLQPRSLASDVTDIRLAAPERPAGFGDTVGISPARRLSAPDGADSAGSAGAKWVEREMRPLLAPYEQQWVAGVNKRLNRIFRFEEVNGDDWPQDGESRPRSGGGEGDEGDRDPASPRMPRIPGMPQLPAGDDGNDFLSWRTFKPSDLRMTKANELTLGFSTGARMSYEVDSRQSIIKLTKPMSPTTTVDVSHESAGQKNALHLNITW